MKKNGFTLTEILAVLVLISALAIIAIPSILNYINNSENEVSEVTEKIIFTGTDLYVDNHKTNYKPGFGKQYCVTLKDVVNSGYLQAPIVDSVNGKEIDLNKFVKITYEYDYDLKQYVDYYDIVDNCENKNYVCKAATEANKTEEGSLPVDGFFAVGDEYKCDPGDGKIRTFYLLEDGSKPVEDSDLSENQVALIMDENILESVDWINEEDYKSAGGKKECLSEEICIKTTHGPITADNALDEQTKEWKYVDVILPTYNQIYAINKSETISSNWLYTNLYNEYFDSAYWTSSPQSDYFAYHVVYQTTEGNVFLDYRAVTATGAQGIRPVIIVDKTNISN